jgi:hypothetical protein
LELSARTRGNNNSPPSVRLRATFFISSGAVVMPRTPLRFRREHDSRGGRSQ